MRADVHGQRGRSSTRPTRARGRHRRLARRAAGEAAPRARAAGRNRLRGVVSDVSFTGVATQYLVRMPWGHELIVVQQNDGSGPRPARRDRHALVGRGPRVRARRLAGRDVAGDGRGARSMAEIAGPVGAARACADAPHRRGRNWVPYALLAPRPALAGRLLRAADDHAGLAVAAGGRRSRTATPSPATSASTPTPSRSTGRSCCARSATPATATVLALLLGYPLAYFIAQKAGRWKNLMLVLVIAPFFTSFLIRTLAWRTILSDTGPVTPLPGAAHHRPAAGRGPDRQRHAAGLEVRGDRGPDLQLPAVHDPAALRRARAARPPAASRRRATSTPRRGRPSARSPGRCRCRGSSPARCSPSSRRPVTSSTRGCSATPRR